MYEGKNIHYSPVDQRPLCSFSGKICRQRRLNGYALCLRHILEDISAPYKRCINLARNGQQCSNVIPQSRNTDYCNSHAHSPAALASTAGVAPTCPSGLSMEPSNLPSNNGFDPSINAPLLNSSPPQVNDLLSAALNGPDLRNSTQHPGQDKTPNHVAGSDDPYAFPSDPEPFRRTVQVTYGSVPQTFPSLSQALATMAATAKVGQPQVFESNHGARADAGVSSIAKLYPELADKLEIGKKSPKNEPTKGKTLSSPSNNKSSRTMNRLQTKIAQNKIKDKLKKSSTSLDMNTSSNCALNNVNASHAETVTKMTLTEPAESVEKTHISTTSSSMAVSNHEKKSRSRNKSKSNAKVKGTSATKSETIPRPLGHFPALESRLQTSPLVNPWAAPIFNIPASIPVQMEDKKQIFQHMGPPVPFLPPRTMVPEVPFMPVATTPNHDLAMGLAGTSVGPAINTVKSNFPVVPVPYIGPTMELQPPEIALPPVQNTAPCEAKAVDTDHRNQSTTVCSNKGTAQSDHQTLLKPSPNIVITPTAPAVVSSPSCVRYRCYKSKYSMKEVCESVKRRSALQICVANEKRKRRNCNLIPMGVDSSEDDTSDYEEWLPAQKEWLISSSESDEDEDMLDDPLLANIRHTKQSLLQAKLRRYFLQSQKATNGNHCLRSTNKRDIATLLRAARFDPQATAEALKLVLHVAKASSSTTESKTLHGKRVCLCKGDQDKPCTDQALPFTNQCNKHIMYNVEQQLYDYCTAKFSDNTQCCIPVFDIRHELPLCPEHAAKAENYQKNLEASRPKKPRKKTKPSALTRPPKKGKKKKNQRKLNQAEKGGPPSVTDVTSGDERTQQLDVEGPCGNDQSEASMPATPPPCMSSPEEAKDDLDPIGDGLGNELEESFSPGTIDKHLELPLGEQDLNEVLNKLPVDAFELFAGKNGEFVNSHMEEEAAAFEHVLAETSKKMKATEVNSRLMMMDHNASVISSQSSLMEDGQNDDEITKEIADSILQQELSPSASMVDDLGQDNISALASSLSVHDLGNISQVLNASLINATSSCDLNNSLYGTTPVQQPASLQQGLHMMTHSGHSSRNHCPIPSNSGLGHGTTSYPYLHTSVANAYLLNATPTGLLSHANTVQSALPTTPQRRLPEVAATPPSAQNGTPSSQSIAQILASLTAGTKQFTSTQSAGDNQPHAGSQPYTSVASIENYIQSPPDKSIGSVGLAPNQSTMGHHQLSTSMDNHFRVPPSNNVLLGAPPNTYLHANSTSSMQIGSSNMSHQPHVGTKIPQTALHNGLLTMPANFSQQQQNVNAFALPIGSAASQLGLRLACPLQTLVPVELLNSSLAQGLPGSVGPVTGNVLTNNGQPLVTMTNASTVLPIATGQAQGSTPGKA